MSRVTFVDPTPAQSIDRLAARLVELTQEALHDHRRFRLAISGGSTPRPLWRQLAGPLRDAVPWTSVELYWADERMVPPESEDSNYGAARRDLLDRVSIPASQIHRVHGELASVDEAAKRYDLELERVFSANSRMFDLVLLGIGPDGHTASLFPGHAAVEETARWATGDPNAGQPPFVPRVTTTLRAMASSSRAYFLVTGRDKRAALASVWGEPEASEGRLPAARVTARDEVAWYLDHDAAPTDRPVSLGAQGGEPS